MDVLYSLVILREIWNIKSTSIPILSLPIRPTTTTTPYINTLEEVVSVQYILSERLQRYLVY